MLAVLNLKRVTNCAKVLCELVVFLGPLLPVAQPVAPGQVTIHMSPVRLVPPLEDDLPEDDPPDPRRVSRPAWAVTGTASRSSGELRTFDWVWPLPP